MPLAEIQHSFMYNLLQSYNKHPVFLTELTSVGNLTQEKQLAIYRSNVNGAHQKVLGQIFPACKNILGEDYFNQLCGAYHFEYPSKHADLNLYGDQFSFFIKKQIKSHRELIDFEYLTDLALLEWHWHISYFAKDDELFNFKRLECVGTDDYDELIFTLNNSLSLHSSIYPVQEIWLANKSDIAETQTFEIQDTQNYFSIVRSNFTPLLEDLNEEQYMLLNFIMKGLSLTKLIEKSEGKYASFQSQLSEFIAKGWVSGFYLQRNQGMTDV